MEVFLAVPFAQLPFLTEDSHTFCQITSQLPMGLFSTSTGLRRGSPGRLSHFLPNISAPSGLFLYLSTPERSVSLAFAVHSRRRLIFKMSSEQIGDPVLKIKKIQIAQIKISNMGGEGRSVSNLKQISILCMNSYILN